MLCLPFLPDFFVALPISRSQLEIPVIVITFSEITRKAVASQRGTPVDFLKALPLPGVAKDSEAEHFEARCLKGSVVASAPVLPDGLGSSVALMAASASGSSSGSSNEWG